MISEAIGLCSTWAGLLIPASWTKAIGISESAYHAVAFSLGTIAGLAAVADAVILIYRRRDG
jgi:nitrate reductase gamma subunit